MKNNYIKEIFNFTTNYCINNIIPNSFVIKDNIPIDVYNEIMQSEIKYIDLYNYINNCNNNKIYINTTKQFKLAINTSPITSYVFNYIISKIKLFSNYVIISYDELISISNNKNKVTKKDFNKAIDNIIKYNFIGRIIINNNINDTIFQINPLFVNNGGLIQNLVLYNKIYSINKNYSIDNNTIVLDDESYNNILKYNNFINENYKYKINIKEDKE